MASESSESNANKISTPPDPAKGSDIDETRSDSAASASAEAEGRATKEKPESAASASAAEAKPAPKAPLKTPPKPAAPPPADSAPLKPAEIAGIFAVLGVLGLGLYFLLRSPSTPQDAKKPPPVAADKDWAVGKTVDVELTLLPNDKDNVACASPNAVNGKHCEWETQDKKWSKPDDPADPNKILKPYATTGSARLIASGMWNDTAFTSNLPTGRFRAQCKYAIEGKLGQPEIRWNPAGPWRSQRGEWWVGALSGCKVL